MTGEVAAVKDMGEDALWIFVGAFAGGVVLNVVSRYVPQVRQFGPYAMLGLGVLGFTMGSGLVKKVAFGAGVSGALSIVNMWFGPIAQSAEQTVMKATGA